MSLLSNFLRKLFGGNNKPQVQPPKTENNYIGRWEQEREKRIKDAESRLKDWLIATVKEKESLPFTWTSGGDEAFVTFEDKTDAEEDNFQELEEYIVDKLDIPDAGEFEMNGSGTIYLQDNLIKAKYSSVMKGIDDYDEETDQVIYSQDEVRDSDNKTLFSV